ncbi:MAG: hypothetical protein NTW27_03430 [Deltaproteobacteria bacterium]|jgi:hypothetical protein|nr:hypothetical protein [Deltaproteobacteria bacterium]
MLRLLFVGTVIVIFSGALSVTSQAQMYWGFDAPEDETIAAGPSDLDDDRDRPVRIRGSVRMYDNSEVPELEPQPVPVPPATAAPIRSRVEDAATRNDVSGSRPDAPLRSPERTPSTAVTSPRPAVTSPGGSQAAPRTEQVQKPEAQVETQKPSSGVVSPTAEQPATKKMKWGQGDNLSEPKSTRPAGEQKTGNR